MKDKWGYRQAIYVFFAIIGGQSGAATIWPLLSGEKPALFSVGMFTSVCFLGAILLATKAFIWMTEIDMRDKVSRDSQS
jgi:hypothetical protein